MSSQRFTAWVMVFALSGQILPLHAFAQEAADGVVSAEAGEGVVAVPSSDATTTTTSTDNATANGVAVVSDEVTPPAMDPSADTNATTPDATPAIDAPASPSQQADAPITVERPTRILQGKLRDPGVKKTDEQLHIPGEVLVKFKEKFVDLTTDVGKAAVRAFADAQRLDLDSTIVASNIAVLRTRDGEMVPAAVARLRWIPEVLHAQPNFQYEQRSNDTLFASLWALENTGQIVNDIASTTPNHDVDAPDAWVKGEGNGAIVAVIDSGVAFNHPDLTANMWDGSSCVDGSGAAIVGGCEHGYDFDGNDPRPLPVTSSHGTHIAGTIAAVGNNNKGIIGLAPQAKIMALRAQLTVAGIINAINFAKANGATIINASWGGYGSGSKFNDSMLKEAIGNFSGVFVVAAGNKTYNHDDGNPDHVSYPDSFDLPNIIVVAATDQGDGLASFSDYGEQSVDVGAPGTNILSTSPYLLEETFEQATPPALGDNFQQGNGSNWVTATSSGNNLLAGRGSDALGNDASTMTSRVVNLATSTNPYLTFQVSCAANSGDGVFVDFWNGSSWDEIDTFVGSNEGNMSFSLSDYRITDFRFRMVWVDAAANVSPSNCLFDDFTIIDGAATADSYSYNEGTSMAAPHVSGVAALVKGYSKNISVPKLKEIILDTGDPLADLAGKTVSGKRVNAAKALEVFAPHVGLAADDVLVAGGHSLEGEVVKFNFRVRDGIADLPFTLKQFEHSTDNGVTWNTPTNGDASTAIDLFSLDGRTTVTDFTGDSAYVLMFNANHADLAGLRGVDQNDVRIRFKANDGAVDSPFAVSDAFSIDLLAPTATLSGPPSAITNATSATITVGGVDAVSYQYSLDGSNFSPATPIATPLVISGLVEGNHTLRVITTDDVGNVQAVADATTFTWAVDTTPGTALLTNKPDARTNTTNATFVIGGEDVATYTYTVDGGASQGPFAVSETIALTDLAEGTHSIAVRGIDVLGNIQANVTTYAWVIDTSAAVPTIGGVPAALTNVNTATLTIGGEDVILYRYSLNGGAFGVETPVATPIALAGLPDGVQTVAVIGRDSVGNWQAEVNAVTVTWTVDTMAPTLTETTPAATPTNNATPTIAITVENRAAWEVLRGETVLTSGTGTGASQTVVLPSLTDGIYTLTLAATDVAGNRATLTLTAFVVDTTSPAGISMRDVPASPTNATTATIMVVAGSDVVAYRFSFDGSAFGDEAPMATPIALTGVADGAHTLRVIGKDAAGNWMPESIAVMATWTVDTVPPVATLENLPRATTPAIVANITVGGAGVVAYRFSLDGGAFGVETPVATPIALKNLADGAHAIAVIGRDAAGNLQDAASAATFSWVVDRSLAVPPTANPSSGVLSTKQEIHFSAPLAENMHYVYQDPETLSCTTGSSMDIEGALLVDRAMTIHVVACYAGGVPSEVRSFAYTFAMSGGGGGGGGGAPTFIFSAPTTSARAVESSAPAAAVAPVLIPGQVLGAREFAGGTLLRANTRDIYLVEGKTLHKIPNLEVLWRYRDRERIEVNDGDIAGYTIGESVLAMQARAPRVLGVPTLANGVLIRVNGGTIYLVEGKTLHKIPNLEVLWRYRNRSRVEVTDGVFGGYALSEPIA